MKLTKNVLSFVIFIFLFSFSVFAYTPIVQSWVFSNSYNLFSDELDAGFNAASNIFINDFYSLEKNYLFAGFLNTSSLDLTQTNNTYPFRLGLYKKEKNPFSLYFYYYDSPSSNPNDTLTYSYSTANKVVGSTTYTYITSENKIEYSVNYILDSSFRTQFLMGFPKFITGLYFNIELTKDDSVDFNDLIGNGLDYWQSNTTITGTNYYDTAGAGAAPDTAVDYIITGVYSLPNSITKLGISIPFYTKIDKYQLYVQLGYNLDTTNYSGSIKEEVITNPQQAVNNVTLDTFNMERFKTTNTISLDTIFTIPDIFKLNEKNKLNFELYFNVALHNMDTSSYAHTTKTYNFPGGGADGTLTANTKKERSYTYANNTDFTINFNSQYFMYFDFPDNFQVAFGPELSFYYLKVYTDPFALLSETVTTYNDNDNNGDYTSTGDTSTKVTTIYYGGTTIENIQYTDILIYIPVSIKFRPFNSFIEFIIGNRLGTGVEFLYETTSTGGNYISENITYDNTGAVISEAYNKIPDYTVNNDLDISFLFQNSFTYVFVVYITDNAKFNLTLTGNSFWDINNYAVQFVMSF